MNLLLGLRRHRSGPMLGAGLLVLSLLLSACGSAPAPASPSAAPAPTPAPAGPTSFRIAIGVDLDSTDPAGQTTTTVSNLLDYAVETLVKLDKDGNLKPGLADTWQVAGDGLSITFKLHSGVKFQDGTAMDANAVKFSFDRLLNPDVKSPQRSTFNSIKSVDAVDPATVRLNLKEPAPYLLAGLTATTSAVISPASVTAGGNTMTNYTTPVGTGPYSFKEYVKGSKVTLEKFKDYWGAKPYYDSVVFSIVPEAGTRETLLQAGQVDMIILPNTPDIPALQKNPAVKVLLASSNRTIFVALNTRDAALQDPRVRQALNYAVNKEDIIKNVLFGAAEPMQGPMAPSLFGYCQTNAYPYDPDKAKSLLQQAGATNLSLKFMSPTGRYVQDFQAAQAIAGYLDKVGVKAQVSTSDWPSYVGAITAPPDKNATQMHVLGWAPSFLDAQQAMVQFQTDNNPPKGLATSFYSNAQVDSTLAQAAKEVNPDKRKQLYCDAEKQVWSDAPWIFLWVQSFPIVYSAKVTGVSFLPNEKFDAIYAKPQ